MIRYLRCLVRKLHCMEDELTYSSTTNFTLHEDLTLIVLQSATEFYAINKVYPSAMLEPTYSTYLCAYLNDVCVGFIAYHMDTDVLADITMAYVKPEHRGKGIYSSLYSRLRCKLQCNGVEKISTVVYNDIVLEASINKGRVYKGTILEDIL